MTVKYISVRERVQAGQVGQDTQLEDTWFVIRYNDAVTSAQQGEVVAVGVNSTEVLTIREALNADL